MLARGIQCMSNESCMREQGKHAKGGAARWAHSKEERIVPSGGRT